MSNENKNEGKNLIKRVEAKKINIDDILNSKESQEKILFKKVFNEIIFELNSLNSIITEKYQINNFSKYENKFLYDSINQFTNLKFDEISKEDIENMITKENLYVIIKIFIKVNKHNIFADNIIEFNKI